MCIFLDQIFLVFWIVKKLLPRDFVMDQYIYDAWSANFDDSGMAWVNCSWIISMFLVKKDKFLAK